MADGQKAFEFAGKKASGEKIIESFTVNGESFDIRPLKDSSVAVLVHKTRNGTPDAVLAAVLNFTEKALTPESAKRFEAICLDPVDGLEMAQIVEVFQYVLGVVGANPSGSSNASSVPPRRTGSRSTAASRSRASTL